MRRSSFFFGVLSFFFFPSFVLGQTFIFPKPVGLMNDFVPILEDAQRFAVEEKLRSFEQSTSNEITVAIVSSLQDFTVEEYAVKLFEEWKIGKKKNDNGILLLIAPKERKARIEVGYGLEGAVPDALAKNILEKEILSLFKQNKYADGIHQGINALMAATQGEYQPEPKSISWMKILFQNGGIIFFFVVIDIVLSYLASFFGRTKEVWPGGVVGALVGAMVGIYFFALWGILVAVVVGGIGFLFDYIVSKNYQIRKIKGLPTDWRHSGGGFWFGGRGGGGGGGFGGFGGGGSGGGGASGSW